MRRNSRPSSRCINPVYSLNPSELSMRQIVSMSQMRMRSNSRPSSKYINPVYSLNPSVSSMSIRQIVSMRTDEDEEELKAK